MKHSLTSEGFLSSQLLPMLAARLAVYLSGLLPRWYFPLARNFPSGLKASPNTSRLCPRSNLGGFLSTTFQIVTSISIPALANGPPSEDSKPLGQSCLCQADVRSQRQNQLTEGIVSLTIRGPFHKRSSFRVTHSMKQIGSDVK